MPQQPTNGDELSDRPADGLNYVAINDARETETQEKRGKNQQEGPKLPPTH
jgi:hypothetical protein